MEEERPGQASVQYDDVRGEAAGDVSDGLGNDINRAAEQLGFKGHGWVVGIEIYGSDGSGRKPGFVSATFCVIEGCFGADDVNKALAKTGGLLTVKKYHRAEVSVVDFVRCFKRLHVNLFSKHIKAYKVRVEDHIFLDDLEA